MRLGYLIPEFPGQTHTFFWRELRALRAKGVEVDVVSTRRPPAKVVVHQWAEEAMRSTHYLNPPSGHDVARALASLGRGGLPGLQRCLASWSRSEGLTAVGRVKLLALIAVAARLASLARERQWAHCHVSFCADAAHVAMFASLISGMPYSLALHAPLSEYGPNQREKWRYARFGTVITQRLKAALQTELGDAAPARLEIAPMGVELERFRRRTPYEPFQGKGTFRVFSCGRLNPAKGHEDLVLAVKALREQGHAVELRIAGEDEQGGTGRRKVFERFIEGHGMRDAVRLLGPVEEEQVREELENAHVFALASIAEPLGVSIMEAMAMELPVIATKAGGVPELIDDGVHGLLVPPRHPQAVALGLHRVREDASLCLRLGRLARTRIETSFHSRRSAEVLVRLLEESGTGSTTDTTLPLNTAA